MSSFYNFIVIHEIIRFQKSTTKQKKYRYQFFFTKHISIFMSFKIYYNIVVKCNGQHENILDTIFSYTIFIYSISIEINTNYIYFIIILSLIFDSKFKN